MRVANGIANGSQQAQHLLDGALALTAVLR
jgi:hypothetical protein